MYGEGGSEGSIFRSKEILGKEGKENTRGEKNIFKRDFGIMNMGVS